MLRYLSQNALAQRPRLQSSMFADRATQFRSRLGWDVLVDKDGFEHDQYDTLADALYVIWERPDGRHGGSLRFLPTMGRTMLAEHFAGLTGRAPIRSPHIWECTRFCLAPGSPTRVASVLMLGGLDAGLRHGLSHAIGVFHAPMIRVYRQLGWPPALLGTMGDGHEAISAGLWSFERKLRPLLLSRAGVSAETADNWCARAFPEVAAAA